MRVPSSRWSEAPKPRDDCSIGDAYDTWPRASSDGAIPGAPSPARALEDAFRLATEELVNWMVDDYGFSPEGALLLLATWRRPDARSANPKYTYITKIAKRFLSA